MKNILLACVAVTAGLSACSTANIHEQRGTVKIEVITPELLTIYQDNLDDFYQVLDEGLLDSAKPNLESLKSAFLDDELVSCAENLECKSLAYENHFVTLHQFVYKNDLSNVEPIYIQSSDEDQHQYELTGFYSFVGLENERLGVFIDMLEISRHPDNEPYGLVKIESIDTILYRNDVLGVAEYKPVGQIPYGKMIRYPHQEVLKSLYYTVDFTDIEFDEYSIGLSLNLGDHQYEINTYRPKVKDIRFVETQPIIEKSLY